VTIDENKQKNAKELSYFTQGSSTTSDSVKILPKTSVGR
jgi:hypothetical protein